MAEVCLLGLVRHHTPIGLEFLIHHQTLGARWGPALHTQGMAGSVLCSFTTSETRQDSWEAELLSTGPIDPEHLPASSRGYLYSVLKGGSSWRSVKPVFFYINTIKGRLESGNGATSSLLPPAAVGLLYSLWFSLDVLLNPQTSLWLTDPSDLLLREGEFALP